MTKKYLLVPGYVYSQTDGDRHWIDAPTLARLYQVSMAECVVVHDLGGELEYQESRHPQWLTLRPRYDGKYDMPVRR